jgi:trimethylamine--corrinoid protein Co-methyltransferase
MSILEDIGIRFHHLEILNVMERNGIKVSGETAFFTEEQVLNWVRKAPGSFTIRAANPRYDMHLGAGALEHAPGYGAPAIVESDGVKRDAVLEDYIQFLKLFHQSDLFKINGGILVDPCDLKTDRKYPILFYHTLMHSDKCLIGMQASADQVEMIMDMVAIVAGGKESLLAQPRITTIVNTLSPLQFDRNALDTLLVYAKHGQPVMVTPAVMAGATGPATLAGTMALSNAEALAGIAAVQMIRDGAPVIYGCQSTSADMRTGGYAIGCPEHALCVTYGAALARFYGLPCRGGGSPNDAKCVSVQSGYESMMVMMATCQAKIDLIVHSAGIVDGHSAMSYEQFVIDLEIIGMIGRFIDGIRVDDDSLALNIIKEVASSGQFLTHSHTLRHCRSEFWTPEVSLRGAVNGKEADEKIMERIRKKREKMLAAYKRPQLPADVESSLHSYLKDKGLDSHRLNS